MYLDLEDYRPDTPRVNRAISVREGILMSLLAHAIGIIIWLLMPPAPAQRSPLDSLSEDAPIRFVQVADDPWGTPAAVGHMAKHFSASVDRSIWRVTPTEVGVQKIGHFGFFRPDLRDRLWQQAATWLLAVQTKPA